MTDGGEKKYQQNGKTIKIIPIKKVKKTEAKKESPDGDQPAKVSTRKPRRTPEEKGMAKFSVDDKVSLKNIPPQYAGSGFSESVILKVFKSTHDQMFRYTIRSASGHELALVKEDQLKPRK